MTETKTLLRIKPGVTFTETGKADVWLWAPLAHKASLVLIKAQQVIELLPAGFGYWHLHTNHIKPGDRYQFLLDGTTTLPDPASLAQPDGVLGASMAIDLKKMARTKSPWQNLPLKNYLIYELHTGTFTPEGTFEAAIGKLGHISSLGITAIEIMPVAQFPGNRNWGYDGVFPYAVQNQYGGAEGLMKLVDACHDKGLAVILDVVYNHVGPEGNCLSYFGPYFTDKYRTPWGNAINFDDAGCDAVRDFFIENALMWFRDFHIDALRLDAVHAIKDFSPKHILQEIKERADGLMAKTGRVYYLIVESDLNDARFIEPLGQHGYGMDAQWIDEFHHALRVTAGGDRNGYYSDFNGIGHLAKAYRDAYVYDGQYSHHREKHFGSKANGRPGKQFVVFSQNHDQVGNRMLGERSSQLYSFGMQKLLAAAVLVSPYLPMLFMGEEWGEPNPFLYFVSHTDAGLIKSVREGRKAEFAAFNAGGEAPDPQAEETFQRSKLSWGALKKHPHKTILDYYRALIALRKHLPALNQLNRGNLMVTADEEQQVLLLHRWADGQQVCCAMNFSKSTRRAPLPAGVNWQLVLDSSAAKWSIEEFIRPNDDDTINTLKPESIRIYTN
jgi:maltooligosyltrehalose trehalohydrolase